MSAAKAIVVTGASSGIGAALTQALAADGHRLFVCARRADQLIAVTRNGRLARWRTVDVADGAETEAFAREVAGEAAMVDALICCAGAYGPIGETAAVDPVAWWKAIQVNLFGTFMAIHAFAPLMTSGDGRIVTFSGGGAFNSLPRYSAYAASKAAVVRLTETVADELRPRGIAVNSVAPGFVKTEIHEATLAAGPDLAGPEYAMTQAKLAEGAVPIETPVDCVRFLYFAGGPRPHRQDDQRQLRSLA